MRKVYPVTSRFVLEQNIFACEKIEHCFYSCVEVCTGDLSRYVLFSASSITTKRKFVFNADLQNVASVGKRTIPTERPSLVGEVSASFRGKAIYIH
jgi:hypothetical protein